MIFFYLFFSFLKIIEIFRKSFFKEIEGDDLDCDFEIVYINMPN